MPAKTSFIMCGSARKPNTTPYTKPVRLHIFGHEPALQFIVPQMSVAYPARFKGRAGRWGDPVGRRPTGLLQQPGSDYRTGGLKPEISAPAGRDQPGLAEEGAKPLTDQRGLPRSRRDCGYPKGANPNLTADQSETLLKELVKDFKPNGPDYANGYGRLDIGDLERLRNSSLQKSQLLRPPRIDIANVQFPVQVFRNFTRAPVAGNAGDFQGCAGAPADPGYTISTTGPVIIPSPVFRAAANRPRRRLPRPSKAPTGPPPRELPGPPHPAPLGPTTPTPDARCRRLPMSPSGMTSRIPPAGCPTKTIRLTRTALTT